MAREIMTLADPLEKRRRLINGHLNALSPVFTFDVDGEKLLFAPGAVTATEASTVGTGTVAYEISTAAAPDTFSSVTLPAEVEEGAWLKVLATGVSGTFGVAIQLEA